MKFLFLFLIPGLANAEVLCEATHRKTAADPSTERRVKLEQSFSDANYVTWRAIIGEFQFSVMLRKATESYTLHIGQGPESLEGVISSSHPDGEGKMEVFSVTKTDLSALRCRVR